MAEMLYRSAKDMAIKHGYVTAMMLQRGLFIGYAQATLLIDRMQQDGLIGPMQPGGKRPVIEGEEGSAA